MRLRSTVAAVHLWLGITIGALWAFQGLTGALLVFSRDAERWSLHEAQAGPMLPLETLFARASAGAGGKEVDELETFGPSPTLFVAYFKDRARQQSLIIDARTGAVKDRRDPEPVLPVAGSSWRWLQHLHNALLLGDDTGGALVGVSGLALLSSLAMGVWLGWPRGAAWKALVDTRRWRSTRQKLFGWHRLAGLGAVAVLVVTVGAGIYLGLAPELRPLLVAHAGYQPPYKARPVNALPAHIISADQAFAAAAEQHLGSSLVRIVRPTAKSPVYTFRLLEPGELRRWAGVTAVVIDPASGRVLRDYDPLRGPLANRISDALFSLHTGDLGGLPGRLLALIAGLSLPALYVTGIWAWLAKRAPRPDS